MNFKGNFKYLAKADVSDIINMANHLTQKHWTLDSTRQKRYEAHTNTQTINIIYDEDFRHMSPSKHPAFDVFGPVIHPLMPYIANYYENMAENKSCLDKYGQGYFIRINLVKLLAQGSIPEHQDKNFSLAHSHRIHIPIITNDQVFFTVGDETINMQVGEIIEINNRRNHSVKNDSQEDRVHLIIDFVIPGEPCCCAEKLHPGIMCNPDLCMPTDRMVTPCTCLN